MNTGHGAALLQHRGRRPTGTYVCGYLELARPANLLTAAANVLAGYAAAGMPEHARLPYLATSGVCLYAGGIVFNDVFDRNLDAVERPERSIPSGRVPVRNAVVFGACLLMAAVGLAFRASVASGTLAIAIACAALVYDSVAKHHPIAGPLNMGLCRGMNVLLGVSAAPAMLLERWYLVLLPTAYVSAITIAGAGEVHGGSKRRSAVALALMLVSGSAIPALYWGGSFAVAAAAPFVLLLAWRVFPSYLRALHVPDASHLRHAVRTGVLSLVLLDAAVAAGYAGLWYGLALLLLLPAASLIARLFSVT
jgi:4-hydroxybenzoate polyprenyltransferase